MALETLDGTSATVDILIAFSGTSGSSMRCVTTSAEYNTTRQYQTARTLCAGVWENELPGVRQDFITINNLVSQGSVISDHSVLFGATSASAVTFQAFTGCTKIGTFWPSTDTMNVAAGIVAMPGQLVLRSAGAVATAWVTE